MGRAILQDGRPPMWAAETGASGDTYVRFGKHRIGIADVTGISIEEIRDKNVAGLILGAVAFAVAATAMTYAVVESGAMLRFLVGASFLAMLAMAGLLEMMELQTLSLYEMRITLADGEMIRFTSVDRDDVLALSLTLTAARAK